MKNRSFDSTVPEQMDMPGLDYAVLEHALLGLDRLNTLGLTVLPIWKQILTYCQQRQLESVSILDLASGSGYLPFALERISKKSPLELRITGSDVNPQCLDFAKSRGELLDSSCQFIELDAMNPGQDISYDIVTCSLFLHHCSSESAIELMHSMQRIASRLILISDLNRTIGGLALAALATRLFSRSKIVHADGITSVRAAFTIPEMETLLVAAKLENARVERVWPARFLVSVEV